MRHHDLRGSGPGADARAASTVPTTVCESILYDYGRLYRSETGYRVVHPAGVEDVSRLLRDAASEGRSIRVRGSGHTFNGCTLPRRGEWLLRTDALNRFAFESRGTLTVGAGALVWDIRDLAARYGHRLPVYNGGWAGPSLGGYISAGGFGKGSLSDAAGGLWENVLEITLVDGSGEVHRIGREDERFPWLFGSYGQLGVIVSARLVVEPEHPLAALAYPRRESGRVPACQADDPRDNDRLDTLGASSLFWFSLLVAPERESDAWQALYRFCERHSGTLRPEGGWAGPLRGGEPIGYRYLIRFRRFNPPLVYPRAEPFLVLGVMSSFDRATVLAGEPILAVERDFVALARRGGFRLYLQAENIGRTVDYRAYYGEAVFGRFEALKRRLDPEYRINPGHVFGPRARAGAGEARAIR